MFIKFLTRLTKQRIFLQMFIILVVFLFISFNRGVIPTLQFKYPTHGQAEIRGKYRQNRSNGRYIFNSKYDIPERIEPMVLENHTADRVEVYDRSATTPISPKNGQFLSKWRRRSVLNIDCRKVFNGDSQEIFQAKLRALDSRENITSEKYIRLTKRCANFKKQRGYILKPISTEEEGFPIAYSILMYKNVEQFERLFRAIYRPQNYYCIHVDKKSTENIYKAVKGITNCFDNVFLLSNRTSVKWGQFSVLKPDIDCMKSLLKYKKWKYFINLTGQEFPLRTNYELVQILKVMNGANDIMSSFRANKSRWKKAGDPPHGIRLFKGSVHITASRDFVEYVIYNQTAIDFLEWCKQTSIPDETFFPTLNHNPQLGIPGSFKGDPETPRHLHPFLSRFKQWNDKMYKWKCHGLKVRTICVFGIEDIPILKGRPEFFVNKLYLDFETFAFQCMEELYFNRTRDEYDGFLGFNTSYYEQLTQFKNVVH